MWRMQRAAGQCFVGLWFWHGFQRPPLHFFDWPSRVPRPVALGTKVSEMSAGKSMARQILPWRAAAMTGTSPVNLAAQKCEQHTRE